MRRFILMLISLSLLAGCNESAKKSKSAEATKPAAKPATSATNTNTVDRPIVVLETDYGDIEIELRPDKAPKTVANFIKLTKDGFYNGLIFHRVIPGFVIQGGDPEGTGRGGPGYTIPAEITDLKHTPGAVATARLPDQVNPQRASSGSQFYIALGTLRNLDGKYTVFGYVTKGMAVAQKIASVKRDAHDKPLTPIHIKKAYVKK